MVKKALQWIGAITAIVLLGLQTFQADINKLLNKENDFLGSVPIANEYHSTTTQQGTGAGNYYITQGASTLGSVVITSSSASAFTIYDADGVTSTPTTTIAIFKAGTAEGTYTFDVAVQQGVVITLPAGFTGNFVTTYR